MIVRIATDAQYRVPEEDTDKLNELDNDAVAAVEAGDEARFLEIYQQMVDMVRGDGEAVADDDLSESDIIMPPPDVSFAEAQAEFTGDGLIPD